ncbi:putative CRISPR associated hypothetical protein [Methanosarcina sp. WWM596]|nr:putative CRISPR associated hypothetical protein [Methanosarcina sp. WWM596]
MLARFIPTRVGNSSRTTICVSSIAVHPHACGELYGHGIKHTSIIGSSPRVWGTPKVIWEESPQGRFIPTRVGNSINESTLFAAASVHPHACGELWG